MKQHKLLNQLMVLNRPTPPMDLVKRSREIE